MDRTQIEKLQQMIEESSYIVFFGGAGVSTESGIPDFRSTDGLYQQKYKYPPETIVSHSFFMQHTDEFYAFYKEKMLFPDASPNAAHRTLARLEEQGKLKAVITQNIDGLHQAAGSKTVLELHGSVHRNYCMRCHAGYTLADVLQAEGIPRCNVCGGVVKPDVVLYEESLDGDTMRQAVAHIAKADMLIIGGTSLAVYPAAGFIEYFHGKHLVIINMTPCARDKDADLVISDRIGEVLLNLS